MPQTIGNPLSWTARVLGLAGHHVADSAQGLGSEDMTVPETRPLEMEDLRHALRAGWQDFIACRSDVMFIVLLYPVMGLVLMGIGFKMALIPLLFPLVMGFALLGPIAAVGVYELSRRRELGEETHWYTALKVVERPSFGAILVLGIYMAALFLVWMLVAAEIYGMTMGPASPTSVGSFVTEVLTTGAGWTLIVIGCGVGFCFALVTLAVSVVSVPLLLDRKPGLPVAITTSIKVTRENPVVILSWGAIVAGALILGALPMLLGLVVVLPVLGHATWHLYRRAVR
ncbi:DUF2189 domain-containing protein [Primorskyibacter sp. 2E233]|uniref:DUF2189 domain-containing protein n=1 Tax=Primorskyibacter sp. 2E233 TaxID=3413431 RepID=UPI003BF0E072